MLKEISLQHYCQSLTISVEQQMKKDPGRIWFFPWSSTHPLQWFYAPPPPRRACPPVWEQLLYSDKQCNPIAVFLDTSPDWEILYIECCWILFLSVISLASLLAADFFSSLLPELLKSVVIPCMIVNLGLQLSTAQSHLLVFLTPHSVHPVFSCAFSLGSQARAWCCSPHTPNLTLKGQEGGFQMMNTQKVSALVYRASIIRLNLYSGRGAFHMGGKRVDIFLSHHAPASGPKLARRVGQFLQGLLLDSL